MGHANEFGYAPIYPANLGQGFADRCVDQPFHRGKDDSHEGSRGLIKRGKGCG